MISRRNTRHNNQQRNRQLTMKFQQFILSFLQAAKSRWKIFCWFHTRIWVKKTDVSRHWSLHKQCKNRCEKYTYSLCHFVVNFHWVQSYWSGRLDMVGSFSSTQYTRASSCLSIILRAFGGCKWPIYSNWKFSGTRRYFMTTSSAVGRSPGSICLHCLWTPNKWNLKLSAPVTSPRKWSHTSGIFQMSVFSSYPGMMESSKGMLSSCQRCSGATKSPLSSLCPHFINRPSVLFTLGKASKSLATNHRSDVTRYWLSVLCKSFESHITRVPRGPEWKNAISLAYCTQNPNLVASVLCSESFVSNRGTRLSAVPNLWYSVMNTSPQWPSSCTTWKPQNVTSTCQVKQAFRMVKWKQTETTHTSGFGWKEETILRPCWKSSRNCGVKIVL